MRKRLKFNCWSCHRNFSLLLEITNQQTLVVPCPFCEAECVVELEPYRKKAILRKDDEVVTSTPRNDTVEELDLPEVLPTQQKQ